MYCQVAKLVLLLWFRLCKLPVCVVASTYREAECIDQIPVSIGMRGDREGLLDSTK